MFGRYVTINCLYVEEPIRVWVICSPNDSMNSLEKRARKMIVREMEKQLKENSL